MVLIFSAHNPTFPALPCILFENKPFFPLFHLVFQIPRQNIPHAFCNHIKADPLRFCLYYSIRENFSHMRRTPGQKPDFIQAVINQINEYNRIFLSKQKLPLPNGRSSRPALIPFSLEMVLRQHRFKKRRISAQARDLICLARRIHRRGQL